MNKTLVIKYDSDVILPGSKVRLIVPLALGKKLLELKGENIIVTLLDRETRSHQEISTLAQVEHVIRSRENFYVDLDGIERVKISEVELNEEDRFTYANYEDYPIVDNLTSEDDEIHLNYVISKFEEIKDTLKIPSAVTAKINNSTSMIELLRNIFPVLPLDVETKQEMLELDSTKDIVEKFVEIYSSQVEEIKFKLKVNEEFSAKNNEAYRKLMLKNQISQAQEELDKMDGNSGGGDKLEEAISNLVAPEYVIEHINSELERFKSMDSNSSEYQITKKYLETLVALPYFSKKNDIDINKTRDTLDERHYKMDEVKKRIIEHLAVMKLKEDKQGSIILLVGPPGTGKTSLASSIAKSLDRPYVRVSLGGVKDESEIRGHRRTYVGAMPGKIIGGMKKAKSNNPVFVLDEIDKLGNSYQGDPASAMLEVLDPEQNTTFVDHYMDLEYDLSQVLFIATANSIQTIPQPLLDRMEVIEINSYTAGEKFHIAKDFLIDSNVKEHGLSVEQISFTDDAINKIVSDYTREAGVRGLSKQIAKICRSVAYKIVSENLEHYEVDEKSLSELLGNKTVRHESIHAQDRPGIVTGLAWTPVGGDVLFIESSFVKGTGRLILTGQLGDVMKESATIALSQVRSILAPYLTDVDFSKIDIHVHVPAGATPKDGPSAGITIFSTLCSLVLNQSVSNKIAMTGELTLTGRILPIGGLKEKSIAAYAAGIDTILISQENERDLVDLPDEVLDNIKFITVYDTDDVLKELFNLNDISNILMINDEEKVLNI